MGSWIFRQFSTMLVKNMTARWDTGLPNEILKAYEIFGIMDTFSLSSNSTYNLFSPWQWTYDILLYNWFFHVCLQTCPSLSNLNMAINKLFIPFMLCGCLLSFSLSSFPLLLSFCFSFFQLLFIYLLTAS